MGTGGAPPTGLRAATLAAMLTAALTSTLTAACSGRAAPSGAPAPRSSARAAFVATVDSVLGDPKWATAQWGALIVDPRTGDTLYSRNAGKFFVPASNQKIITGAVALARLGPEYRWRTVLAAVGRPGADGTLASSVYVFGSGDPTVSDVLQRDGAMAPLRRLADSLRARGVRRVGGEVVAVAGGAAGRFPEGPWKFGWEWDDLDTPSGGGVTELLFNDGVARVTVYGGARAGDGARFVVRPTDAAIPFDVHSDHLRTVASGDTAARPRAAWDYDAGHYTIRGAVPVGDSVTLELGIHDPRRAYASALARALRAGGIAVDGNAVTKGVFVGGTNLAAGDYPGDRLDTLAVLTSAPLRDVLPALEKPSQNQIAEALFLTLGREGTGVGSGDSARRVVGDQLRAWGVEPEHDVAVRDGSGLSRHDFVTPTAIVRVLDGARRLPAFRVFYDALPIAGVDGTLGNRMRGTPAAGRVHAKTGSVDRVRSLSGYVETGSDGLLIFSLLCNNFTTPSADVTRAQDTIIARLAALGPRGAP